MYCQQYHAFGAIRLCYPKGFFDDSLQALRIQENTETPTTSPNKLSKTSSDNAEKDHPRAAAVAGAGAAAAGASAAAANEVLGPVSINQRTDSGAAGDDRGSRLEVEKERWMLSNMPWADLGSHDSSKRQAAEEALAHARLQPLPAVRGPRFGGSVRRGSRSRKSSLKRPGPTPHHAVGAREKGVHVGNGYWDLVGGNTGLQGKAVERREEVATATASVVLLRWAMEDRRVDDEDVDVSEGGVESVGENEWEPSAGDNRCSKKLLKYQKNN